MTLRDLDIDVDVEIDASPIVRANHLVDDLLDKMRQLGRKHRIDVELSNTAAAAEIRTIEAQMRQLTASPHRIDVEVDSITSDVMRVQAQLQPISRHNIDVDVDTAGAMAQIALLQAQLATLKRQPLIKPQIPNLPKMPSIPPPKFGGLSGPLAIAGKATALAVILPTLQVAVGAIGTLGVSVGVLGGGLLSLGSAAGVAAIGLGGFAALGISAISELYDENAKLTAAQKELKKHTDSVVKSWQDLNKTLQPFTFGAIESGAASINTLLERSEPILERATIAVDGLFDSFNKSLKGENMTSFFDYAERSIGAITTNIGNGIGLLGQSVTNTMVALEPLTNWSAQGFENSMGRFADWTAGLKDSDKLKEFMEYTQINLPKIGSIMKDATGGVTSFFAAFDVTASDGLDWMSDKMKSFATWAGNLDESQGFQNMLSQIKADGPAVAKIAGDIAGAVVDITGALASFGRDDGEKHPMLDYLSRLTSGELIPKEIKWAGKLFGFGGDDAPKIDIKVDADTAKAQAAIQSLATDKIVDVPMRVKMDPMATANSMGSLPQIGVYAKVEKLDTTQIGPVKMPMQQDNGIVDRLSAVLNSFMWPQLPKFEWPRFDWPAYPKFSWPPVPTVNVRVNVSDGVVTQSQQSVLPFLRLPGFSSGLGRVPYDDMPAFLHKNEAILPEYQAETLRDMGVLQGDGRNPIVDTSHLAPHNTTRSSTTNTSMTNNITINVQGGNTNAETASNLEEVLDNYFQKFNIVMGQRYATG